MRHHRLHPGCIPLDAQSGLGILGEPFLLHRLPQHAGERDDRAERVAKVVRDERGVLFPLLFETPQLRHVTKDDDRQRDLAVRISHARACRHHPSRLAVRWQAKNLAVHEVLATKCAAERVFFATQRVALGVLEFQIVEYASPSCDSSNSSRHDTAAAASPGASDVGRSRSAPRICMIHVPRESVLGL